jgi:hypothetical protein
LKYRQKDIEGTDGKPGELFPYQKLVRDYLLIETPYRGLLLFHGLGSGKTCTAIAASEALYSTANKKIIVMTPFSLRKNFLKEVSLCGFRHFRLNNFWTSLPVDDDAARLFATSVLGIPESHLRTASSVWIPDFRKTPEESNYASLAADEQTEIRKQILSVLIWDPVKNPSGRIRFINYNGISAKKLKDIACKKPADFFYDAENENEIKAEIESPVNIYAIYFSYVHMLYIVSVWFIYRLYFIYSLYILPLHHIYTMYSV